MILSAPMSEEVAVPGSEAVEKAGERLRMIERILFGACGALLLGGFVLPWFTAGALLSFSGLGLVFAGGEMVGMLAGANRFLLIAVPLLGLFLAGGALQGHRATRWLAVGGSGILLFAGFLLLVRFVLTTTGIGMWLVIIAAMVSLSIGLVSLGRSQR